MHILVAAATAFEFLELQQQWPSGSYGSAFTLDYLETGVGPVFTAITLTEYFAKKTPDLFLNIGVAGAIDRDLELGEVVHVTEDCFGDLGVEEKDGSFINLFTLGLAEPNTNGFRDGVLHMPKEPAFAPQVRGTTVSTAHGSQKSIDAFTQRSSAQVESMEGAAAFLVALRNNSTCIQLRAISNYVEPRDRKKWKLELALTQLTAFVDGLFRSLPGAEGARSAKLQLGL